MCPRCGCELYLTLFRGTDRLYRTTQDRFNLVECAGCGLIRLDPMPTPAELARFYPNEYWWDSNDSAVDRLSEIYRRLVLQDHVHFVTQGDLEPGPVLDIGCGGGSFLAAIKRRGHEVIGMDYSARAARIAGAQHGVPAACGRLPALPFRAQSFSAVTLFHVLEHVPDPMACLLALWELPARGGRLIIQVPNASCWQLLLLGDKWSGLDVPRHLIHYRAEDLSDLLDACGFEVRRAKYFSLRDNPAGLATSLCPQLEPVARRVRRVQESKGGRLLKDLLYFALVVAAVPFTLLEAAAAAGSTVMVEAVRKGE
ncbi:MAG: class I SAM-dependent methyltransferase [Bryobacterales bacterium]